jgi:hypothetical protein
MSKTLFLTWSANFSTRKEREKHRCRPNQKNLHLLSGKLQLENEKMSIEEFVHMPWEHIFKHEIINNELAEMALGIPFATCAKFDLI